ISQFARRRRRKHHLTFPSLRDGPLPLPRYAAERRSERHWGETHLATILSALGGRYLSVKTLSGAGAAGRPKASATSLTERAKRSGSTSPMPLALTNGVRMLVCSEICRRSVSSASSISGSRFLAAAIPSLL